MTSGEYVQRKLQAWAVRQGLPLQGSAGDKGRPNYTRSAAANIFEGTILPSVKTCFEEGAGGELRGKIPTMSALHSSAAMTVNLFQYWVKQGDLATLARLLAIPSPNIGGAKFEDHFEVCEDSQKHGFAEPPHLDFALRYANGDRVGIECKLFEPYGRVQHSPLKRKYLELGGAWDDIPGCRLLAEQLAVGDAGFHRLGASQLIKHILGLKFGADVKDVRLLYLYYDAIGADAAEHRGELARFQEHVAHDSVRFVVLSVQEFIVRAVTRVRATHTAYVDYLAARYL
jgi:hypothetical protein